MVKLRRAYYLFSLLLSTQFQSEDVKTQEACILLKLLSQHGCCCICRSRLKPLWKKIEAESFLCRNWQGLLYFFVLRRRIFIMFCFLNTTGMRWFTFCRQDGYNFLPPTKNTHSSCVCLSTNRAFTERERAQGTPSPHIQTKHMSSLKILFL